MSDFDIVEFWDYFVESLIAVFGEGFGPAISAITEILFQSKIVVFTAVFIAFSAISAIVYII